ncbi:MAG: hypothetical protein WBG32_04885 [Nodosilinea sp.]
MEFSTEKELQAYAVNKLQRKGIKCQAEFPVGTQEGRIDILTDEHIIECKLSLNRKNAYEAIGQLNHYKNFIQEEKELVILTAHISSSNLKKIIENTGIKIWLAPDCFSTQEDQSTSDCQDFQNRTNPYMNDHEKIDESELEDQDRYEYPRFRIRWTFRSEASNLGFSGKFIYRCRWILRHEFNDVAIYLKRLEDPPSRYEEELMKALEDFDIIQKTVMTSTLEIAMRRFESGIEKTTKSMFGVIEYTVYDFATGKEFNEELSVKSPTLLDLWRKLFRKM